MANPRMVEKIYKTFFNNNPQAYKEYLNLLKTNPKEASKMLNSIFTGYLKTAKDFTTAGKNWLAGTLATTATAGAIANATANPSSAATLEVAKAAVGDASKSADTITDYIVPFYSGTKEQIKAVNDYLDGNISKDEYYKRIANGTLSNALDGLLMFVGGKAASKFVKQQVKNMINKGIQVAAKQGVKAANAVVKNEAAVIRNQLVKANPTASKLINQGKETLSSGIDNAFKSVTPDKALRVKPDIGDAWNVFLDTFGPKVASSGAKSATSAEARRITEKAATQGVESLTKGEEESLVKLIKDNSEVIKKLAAECGVKSKAEIPNFLSFLNKYAKLLKYSPKVLRSDASKLSKGAYLTVGGLSTGITLRDMWQEWNEWGMTDFVPNVAGGVGRIAGSWIPFGGPLTQLTMASLGYFNGDKLARVALRKLGMKDVLSHKEKEEVEKGYRMPGLSQQLDEYHTGLSGRRYHIVNDKIYAFDTGAMTSVNAALDDIVKAQEFKKQNAQDKINQNNQMLDELARAEAMGYDVDRNQAYNLIQENQQLEQEIGDTNKVLEQLDFSDEYDEDDDLAQQVYDKEIKPGEIQTEQERQQNAQIRAQNLQDIMDIVTQQNQQYIDQYFTPENLAADYFTHMREAAYGRAARLTPDEFAQIQKSKAMYQMLPSIREKALNELNTLEQLAQSNTKLGIEQGKLTETMRNNYVKNLIEQFKANETARHNQMQEQIGVGNLNVNQNKAQIAQQQADTARDRAKTYQEFVEVQKGMMPYRQFQAMGQGLAGAAAGEVDSDKIINANPEIGKIVFPAAFQTAVQEEVVQEAPQKGSSISDFYQGVQNKVNQLKGQ